MTEEERKLAIAKRDVIQAYLDGKPVQYRLKDCGGWITNPNLSLTFNFEKFDYRVKPEPTYRPYEDTQEFTKDVIAKGPVIKYKNGMHSVISSFGENYVFTVGGTSYTYKALLKDFCWASDASPCGIKQE